MKLKMVVLGAGVLFLATLGTFCARAQTKAFDPHDLTGIWGPGAGAVPCHVGGKPTDPPDSKCAIAPEPRSVAGGYHILPVGVAMTPWARAKWEAGAGENGQIGIGGKDPYEQCDPLGVPRTLLGYIHPMEILQVPGKTVIIYEEEHQWRYIYTDGRPIPTAADLPFGPTWMGVSIGHWEGNNFVVDVVGMNDKTWIDQAGRPHSEDLHLTEIYNRADHDTLNISFTIDDPKAYTKVWTYGPKKYELKTGKDWEIAESFCVLSDENEFQESIRNPADTVK